MKGKDAILITGKPPEVQGRVRTREPLVQRHRGAQGRSGSARISPSPSSLCPPTQAQTEALVRLRVLGPSVTRRQPGPESASPPGLRPWWCCDIGHPKSRLSQGATQPAVPAEHLWVPPHRPGFCKSAGLLEMVRGCLASSSKSQKSLCYSH